jgi:hypothetical protein
MLGLQNLPIFNQPNLPMTYFNTKVENKFEALNSNSGIKTWGKKKRL